MEKTAPVRIHHVFNTSMCAKCRRYNKTQSHGLLREPGSNTRASWLPFARLVAAMDKSNHPGHRIAWNGSTIRQRSFNEQYMDVLAALLERDYSVLNMPHFFVLEAGNPNE